MRTKKGEKEKLRAVILDKAIAYLKRHGRSGAGTDGIMKFAGLTRGALYSHFKSKEELFAQAVCHDLAQLEATLRRRIAEDGSAALSRIIVDHLSEKSLTDIEGGCAFTSLSTDMQRSGPRYRGMYEAYMDRIYGLFAEALRREFPRDRPEELQAKALNLYSGLVGTLTMARTMKNRAKALAILEEGRRFLVGTFVPSGREIQ